MRVKFRKFAITALFVVLAVSLLMYGVSLAVKPTPENVGAADKPQMAMITFSTEGNLTAGGQFTLVTRAHLTDYLTTEWATVTLYVVPLAADGTIDEDTASKLSVAGATSSNVPVDWGDLDVRSEYTAMPSDEFKTSGMNRLQLVVATNAKNNQKPANEDIVMKVNIAVDATFTGKSITFGLIQDEVENIITVDDGGVARTIATMPSRKAVGTMAFTPTTIGATVQSSDATLKSLEAGHNGATTTYSGATLTDNIAMTSNSAVVNNFKVIPTVNDSQATVKVGVGTATPTLVTSGTGTTVSLDSTGVTTIKTIVTAGDGTTKTYTITVTSSYVRLGSADIKVNRSSGTENATVSPVFDKDTDIYTVSIPSDATSVDITPTVAAGYGIATALQVTPTGCSAANTVNSGSKLSVTGIGASSSVKIKATAKDGTTTKTYTFNFTKVNADSSISGDITVTGKDGVTYTKDTTQSSGNNFYFKLPPMGTGPVEYKAKLNITTTATAGVTVKVGTSSANLTAYSASQLYDAPGTYIVEVSSDAGTKTTYTVYLLKDVPAADINNLQISFGNESSFTDVKTDAGFNSSTNTYTKKIAPTDLIKPGAKVYIRGDATVDATLSSPAGLTKAGTSWSGNLAIGLNTYSLKSAASGGGEKTYTFKIELVEEKSGITDITADPTPSTTAFTPPFSFNQGTATYTLSVPYTMTSIKFTVTAEGNYTLVNSGKTSANAQLTKKSGTDNRFETSLSLSSGLNTIHFQGQADTASGAKGTDYVFNITRQAADTDATLRSLSIAKKNADGTTEELQFVNSSGNPVAFSPTTTAYTVWVNKNGLTSLPLTIAATANSANAKSVSGTGDQNFTMTGSTENSSTYNITVTAESGATKSYTITVQRKIRSGDFTELKINVNGMGDIDVLGSGDYNSSNNTYTVTYNMDSDGVPVGAKAVITPTVTDEASIVATKLTQNGASYEGTLAFGINTYALKASSNTGNKTVNFRIILKEEKKRITNLTVTKDGAGLPGFTFSEGQTDYTVNVPYAGYGTVLFSATTDGSYTNVVLESGTKFTRSTAPATEHSTSVSLRAGDATVVKFRAVSDNADTTLNNPLQAGDWYTVTINRGAADNSTTLDGLYVTIDGVTVPFKEGAFDPDTDTYTIDVTYDGKASSKVKLNYTVGTGKTVTGDTAEQTFTFQSGREHSQTYRLTVKAESGATQPYSVTINRVIPRGAFVSLEMSKDASSWESILEQFSDTVDTYELKYNIADVPIGTKLYFRGTLNSKDATATGSSNLIKSSSDWSGTLKFGPDNKYTLTATSAKASTAYKINVNLVEELNNITSMRLKNGDDLVPGFTFDVGTSSYNVTVPFAVSKVKLEAESNGQYVKMTSDDGDLTKSGSVYGREWNLNAGQSNNIRVYAVADEGRGAEGLKYTINITRAAADTNVTLDSLTVTIDGTLYDISFDPGKNAYTIELEKGAKATADVAIAATPKNATATVTGTGNQTFTFKDTEEAVASYPITVKSESGATNTYTITLQQKIKSGEFTKLEFAPRAGEYADVFGSEYYNAATHTYTRDINMADINGIGSWVYIRGAATNGANVTPTNLKDVTASGDYTHAFYGVLELGKNEFKINVSSAKGSTPYTFIINLIEGKKDITDIAISHNGSNLDASVFTFNADTKEYSFGVPNSVNSVSFKVTTNGYYSIVRTARGETMEHNNDSRTHTLTSSLNEGEETRIQFQAYPDGGNGGEPGPQYTFLIRRTDKNTDANLKKLDVRVGGQLMAFDNGVTFDPNTLTYTIQVPQEMASGSINLDAEANAATSTVTGAGDHTFSFAGMGDKTQSYTITVTAESGTTKVYTVIVSQKPIVLDSNFNISQVVIMGNDGVTYYDSGSFDHTQHLSYDTPITIEVPYVVSMVTVVATPETPTTQVMGAGMISLKEGGVDTDFSVYGVAQDNTNSNGEKYYGFIIKRAKKSADTGLAEIRLNGSPIANFSTTTYYYTSRYDSSTQIVLLQATAQDSNATVSISVAGNPIASDNGTASGPISLGSVSDSGITVVATINVTIDDVTTPYTVSLVRSGQTPRLTYLTVGNYAILSKDGKPIESTNPAVVSKYDDFYVEVDVLDACASLTARTDAANAEIRVTGAINGSETESTVDIDLEKLFKENSVDAKVQISVIPLIGEPVVYNVHFKSVNSNTNATITFKDIGTYEVKPTSLTAYLLKEVDFKTERLNCLVDLETSAHAIDGTYEIVKKVLNNSNVSVDNSMVAETSSRDPHDLTLDYGTNVFCINITSSDGRAKKSMVFVIERGDPYLDYLRASEIEELESDYDRDKTEYFYRVGYGVDKLSLKVGLDEKMLSYEVAGDKDIKTGLNQVKIYVYENDMSRAGASQKKLLKTITLNIYREEAENRLWLILFCVLLVLAIAELIAIILIPRKQQKNDDDDKAPQVIVNTPQPPAAPQAPTYVPPMYAQPGNPYGQPYTQQQQPVNVEVKIVGPDGQELQ